MNSCSDKRTTIQVICYRDSIEGGRFFLILTALAIYFYFSLGLILPLANGIPAIVLILLSFWCMSRHTSILKTYPSKWLLLMYLLPCITAIPHFIMDYDFEVFDTPFRYILAIPLLWLIPYIRINPQFILFSTACGLWVGGIGAMLAYSDLIDYYIAPPRLTLIDGVHTIFYAYLQTALFMLTLIYLLLLKPTRRLFVIFILVGLGLGLFALYSSGTRGSWATLSIMLPILIFIQYKNKFTAKRLLLLLSAIIILIISSTQIPELKKNYMNDLTKLTVALNKPENLAKISLGERLVRGHEALSLFLERPLIGWGYQQRLKRHQQYIEEGRLYEYSNYNLKSSTHNEILHMASQRGIIGLIALLSLYVIPVWIARKKTQFVRTPIIILTITYLALGLTEAPLLYHQATALFYAFTIPLLLSVDDVPDSNNQIKFND